MLVISVLLFHWARAGAQSHPGFDLSFMPQFEVATNVAVASSDYTKPGRPGIASDGTNYLVVSCRFDTQPLGLFGVLISPRGSVLDSFFITPAGDFANPSVAFDGSNYLVVFQRGGGIYGSRISASGQPLDGPDGFPISSSASNWKPSTAFDGTNYLVVWDKYSTNYNIYGAQVTAAGQVLDEFPVFTASGEQVFSALTFGAGNYFVVWRDTRSGSGPDSTTDIFGTRVSANGAVLDPAGISICTAPEAQAEPSVTFDGQNYFVVWVDARRQDSLLHIVGSRVTPGGILLDGPSDAGGIVINEFPVTKLYPRVCFDGRDLLVTWWADSYFSPNGIFGARVSPAGLLRDGPATGLGLQIAGPDCGACRLVNPNPAFNGQAVLVPYVLNSGMSPVLARLVIPRPTIAQLTRSNTTEVTLVVASRLNQRFGVQMTTNLSATVAWQSVETNLAGTGELLIVPLGGFAAPTVFFRLSVDY